MLKTHTFHYGKYRIHGCNGLNGCCDVPDSKDGQDQTLEMFILNGRTRRAFRNALHEALHAQGVPDQYLHDKDGFPSTHQVADFCWRWLEDRGIR